MRLSKLLAVTLISTLSTWTSANAALITSADSITGPVDIIDFSDHAQREITLGPAQVGNLVDRDVVYTATNDYDVAGFSGELFGIGRNGMWNQSMNGYAMSHVDDPSTPLRSTMRFTFNDGPVSAVGAFMNYCISSLTTRAPCDGAFPVLRVLGASMNVIEVYDLWSSAPIFTPDALNAGAFRGIVRDTADIYAFEFMGVGVIDNLTFTARPASVPEPATNALLGLGLGLMVLSRRRRGSFRNRLRG